MTARVAGCTLVLVLAGCHGPALDHGPLPDGGGVTPDAGPMISGGGVGTLSRPDRALIGALADELDDEPPRPRVSTR